MPLLSVGEKVGRRYRVRQLIAHGGAACVYEAYDRRQHRLVALKVARPEDEDDVRQSFTREARAYRAVHSRHLPVLIGTGKTPAGSSYLALELLQGESLAHRLARGPLTLPALLECVRQLLEALKAVHRCGLVHCDVKPSNIVLADAVSEPHLKLVDFGICRRAANPEGRGRHLDNVPGTPPYMSPEQLRGEPVDGRTDVYATGVLLYRVLTGRLPFKEATPEETIHAVLSSPLIPPRALRPSCPHALERVVLRAIARRPGERQPSASVLARELAWVAARHRYPTGAEAWHAPAAPARARKARHAERPGFQRSAARA